MKINMRNPNVYFIILYWHYFHSSVQIPRI